MTEKKTLFDLTQEAMSEIEMYRNPDLTEWREAIDPVLKALGQCVVGSDQVSRLERSGDFIRIEISYSVRCCSQTSNMTVPVFVLKSDDPILEANKHRIRNEITELRGKVMAAQRTLAMSNSRLMALESDLFILESKRKRTMSRKLTKMERAIVKFSNENGIAPELCAFV